MMTKRRPLMESAIFFAAILGLITLVGLMAVHVYPPESRLSRVLWGTLVLAYLISVAAAIMRPAMVVE